MANLPGNGHKKTALTTKGRRAVSKVELKALPYLFRTALLGSRGGSLGTTGKGHTLTLKQALHVVGEAATIGNSLTTGPLKDLTVDADARLAFCWSATALARFFGGLGSRFRRLFGGSFFCHGDIISQGSRFLSTCLCKFFANDSIGTSFFVLFCPALSPVEGLREVLKAGAAGTRGEVEYGRNGEVEPERSAGSQPQVARRASEARQWWSDGVREEWSGGTEARQ